MDWKQFVLLCAIYLAAHSEKCLDGCLCTDGLCFPCDKRGINEDLTCPKCPLECMSCDNTSSAQCHKYRRHRELTSLNQNGCDVSCELCEFHENRYICTVCPRGYFSQGQHCEQCKSNCSECLVPRLCKNCSESCRYCPDNCASCIIFSNCTKCRPGYFGEICENNCSDGCKDKICDRVSGYCNCTEGMYGQFCETACPQTCKSCLSESYCDKCNPGYYGMMCENKCHFQCLNGLCEKNSGECQSCETEKFGRNCTQDCPDACLENTCEQNTGECLKGCKSAMYGPKCEFRCPKTCLLCNSSSSCQQCHIGYSGGLCRKETASVSLLGSLVSALVFGVVAVTAVFLLLSVKLIKRKISERIHRDEELITYSQMDMVHIETLRQKGGNSAHGRTQPVHVSGECDIELADEDAYGNEENVIQSKHRKSSFQTFNNLKAQEGRISLDQLRDYVANKSIQIMMEEFVSLPKRLMHPYAVSQRAENATKNRYRGIFPYDKNRVVLATGNGDYINASYINGHEKRRAYIACIGPTVTHMENFAPFWEMVWQENVNTIVMLTNLFERGFSKCDKYWPDNGHAEQYGEIVVLGKIEDIFDEYVTRTFIIKKHQYTRVIRQIHFTAWPDKSVPATVSSSVRLQREVRQLQEGSEAPLLVHCSAGVGRTGTFLALDILTEQGMAEGYVDIYACVRNLREERVKLVQTFEQYCYLHLAVVESLLPDTNMPVQDANQQRFTIYSTDVW